MKRTRTLAYFALPSLATLALAAGTVAHALQEQNHPVSVTGWINHPDGIAPTPDLVSSLRVPPGFHVSKFAEGLQNPRVIRVSDDGTVYVTSRKGKNVVMLKDTDGDGAADVAKEVAKDEHMHGLALHDGKAWLAGVHDVWVADILPDGTFSEKRTIIDDLPDAGQHEDRTLDIGPDGKLYISVGSTCNTCNEPNPENATMLQATLDGKDRKIFASGLRNTIGFDWHPSTHTLFGWDQGIDWEGDEIPHEEINRIEEGKRYGWPYLHDKGDWDPTHMPKMEKGYTLEKWREESVNPELMYTAHSAGMQLMFYTGSQFPAEYKGDAFASLHGSWNRRVPSGYEVVRVRFGANGKPTRIEPFMSGFVRKASGDKHQQFGRPVGLAMLKDGSLLVGDDTAGVIYRVSYTPATGRAMRMARVDTTKLSKDLAGGTASMQPSSPTFSNMGMIPLANTDYGDKKSPALTLPAMPSGTRRVVLMMEDPDAEAPKPFVHWLISLPPTATSLPEDVAKVDRPDQVPGAVQGSTSTGTVGYYGPRPPVGDPPHRYHFQFFALDTDPMLQPGFTRAAALDAMRGHVLAQGVLVGRFSKE